MCLNRCVNKFAQFNQTMMKVYVEVQTEINTKRMQELQEQQTLLQQNQQTQLEGSANTTAATSTFSAPAHKLPA